MMADPVTIASGCTYERQYIKQHFEMMKTLAEKVIQDQDSEDEDEEAKQLTVSDFMKCPKTMQIVDPDVMVPNVALFQATQRFIEENKWAYQFDPREKYEDIKIWN